VALLLALVLIYVATEDAGKAFVVLKPQGENLVSAGLAVGPPTTSPAAPPPPVLKAPPGSVCP
jgi:hypothetical protein